MKKEKKRIQKSVSSNQEYQGVSNRLINQMQASVKNVCDYDYKKNSQK